MADDDPIARARAIAARLAGNQEEEPSSMCYFSCRCFVSFFAQV